MASGTVNIDACTVSGGSALHLDSIPVVDLRLFSQSELYSLSMCSSSVLDLCRCDKDVIPKIDRSVFNESAGSRKQTYSRLRLAPPSSSSAESRRRDPQLSHASTSVRITSDSASETKDAENMQIVNLLKQLFVVDMNLAELVAVKGDNTGGKCPDQFLPLPPSALSNLNTTGKMRKRGSPSWTDKSKIEQRISPSESGGVDLDTNVCGPPSIYDITVRRTIEDSDRVILNTDGAAVDLVALGSVEHPYTEEIKRRTQGLRSKDDFVGFLEGLNGQWRSRSKRKKIVYASLFGSALPVGWKIMLSIKKNGQIQLSCRRYISPGGLYFVTCRGASSYLCSLHGIQCDHASYYVQYKEIVNDADKSISATIADPPVEVNIRDVNLSPKMLPSTDQNIGVEMESLEVVMEKAGELLYCSNCDGTFSCEEDLSLHYAAAHKRKRYKNGVHESDDVIIKDDKYEYMLGDAHVDAHVSSQAKNTGDSLPNGTGSFYNLNSSGQFSVQDHMDEKSLTSDGIKNEMSNNQPHVCSPCYKRDEHVGGSTDANVSMRNDHEANANSSVADVLHSMRMNLLRYECQNVSSYKMVEHEKISLNRSPELSNDESHGTALFCLDGESGAFEKVLYPKIDVEECGSVDQQKSYETDVNKMHFRGSSFVSASNDEKNISQMNEQSKKRDTSESMYNSEYVNVEVCRREINIAESDEFQYPVTRQRNDHFEPCHGMLQSNPVAKTDHDRKYEISSSFTSDKLFTEGNMNIVFNDDLEGHVNKQCDEGALFASSDGGCVFDTVYGQQHREIERKIHDPSLSFGHLQTKLCSDSNRIKQGSYREGGFTTQTPAHNRAYVNQACSSMIDGSTPGDLKLGMPYAFNFTETRNTFDISQRERDWNGSRSNKIGTYVQNMNVGNGSQYGVQMNADVSWRNRGENGLQGCFPTTSAHRVTSPNHFHNFGIAMDQGGRDDALDEMKMNNEPVEYSFMGGDHHTSNLFPREQHNMLSSYKRDEEQEQERCSGFWVGKDALRPTMGPAFVCVLCRNMFFEETVQISNICPSCRSRFPGQFNLL